VVEKAPDGRLAWKITSEMMDILSFMTSNSVY